MIKYFAILNQHRLRLYPRIILAAVVIAFIVTVGGSSGSSALVGRLGGDFPAFYAAGYIVAKGERDNLYNWDTQKAAQSGLFPDNDNIFLAFAYPPYLAFLYQPLSKLSYRTAYILYTAFMFCALFFGFYLLGCVLPGIKRWWFEAFCLSTAFFPIFKSLFGGHLTSLMFFLLVVIWHAYVKKKDLLTGFCLGLLLIKPQFALPFIGLFLLTRRYNLILGISVSASLLFMLGAVWGGLGWPLSWWHQIGLFHLTDQSVNAHNSIGFLGFSEAVLGTGKASAIILGAGLSLSTVIALIYLWLYHDKIPFDLLMAASVCGVILLQPHIMYYDGGLIILTFAVMANRGGRTVIPLLAAFPVLAFSLLFADYLGFNPMFFLVLAATVLSLQHLRPFYRFSPIRSKKKSALYS